MKSTKDTSGLGRTKTRPEEFDLVILGVPCSRPSLRGLHTIEPGFTDPLLAFFTTHAELRATRNYRGRFRMEKLRLMRNARL
jgi:hypothetical protein